MRPQPGWHDHGVGAVKLILSALIVALVIGGRLTADTPAPKLTEVQRLMLQNKVLRARLAQAELDAIVKEYTIPGYDLTAEGDYVKHPEKAAP